MKSRLHLSINVGTLIAATVVFSTGAVSSEPTAKSNATQSKPIPQSVYVVPSSTKDGRDPFFPNSDRLNARIIVKPTANTPSITLILNGLSPGLAMINGRTMAPGEESDVTASNRRVHIRLIEIKDKEKTVVVEIEGGERRELSLRGN